MDDEAGRDGRPRGLLPPNLFIPIAEGARFGVVMENVTACLSVHLPIDRPLLLGEFAVRRHLDRACGPLTERTFLCAGLSPRHRRLQSEVLYERIEILVAVKQGQSLLDAACRDQCVDGFSDGDAK